MNQKTFGLFLLMVTPVWAVTPEQHDLAREVVKATHADQMVEGLVGQLKQGAQQTISNEATQKQLSRDEILALEGKTAAVEDSGRLELQKVEQEIVKAYAEVYSIEELQAMKSFYNSAEGQSSLAKQPELMKKFTAIFGAAIQQAQKRMEEAADREASKLVADRPH